VTVRIRLSGRQALAVRDLVHQAAGLAVELAEVRGSEVQISRAAARALLVGISLAILDRHPQGRVLDRLGSQLEAALRLDETAATGERP
jgi:hypothetical protein